MKPTSLSLRPPAKKGPLFQQRAGGIGWGVGPLDFHGTDGFHAGKHPKGFLIQRFINLDFQLPVP